MRNLSGPAVTSEVLDTSAKLFGKILFHCCGSRLQWSRTNICRKLNLVLTMRTQRRKSEL